MTKQPTNTAQRSLRDLIADDSYLMAFQTVGQYRAGLLQHVDRTAAQQAAAPGALDADEMTQLSRLMRALGHTDAFELDDDYVRGILCTLLGQAAGRLEHEAPSALLQILRNVYDTLAIESDSNIVHFEDDEEREGATVQYAARKVMGVIDLLQKCVAE